MNARPNILDALSRLPVRNQRDLRAQLFVAPELFQAAQERFERKANAIATGNTKELKRILHEERSYALALIDRLAQEEIRGQLQGGTV